MARNFGDNPLATFGALLASMGGGVDVGATFPQSDADDLQNGAMFIPGEVTMARRRGEKVTFVTACNPNCWYWEFKDGTRTYHFDQIMYQEIGIANGRSWQQNQYGDKKFPDGVGPCPRCGNEHTGGGTFPPSTKTA